MANQDYYNAPPRQQPYQPYSSSSNSNYATNEAPLPSVPHFDSRAPSVAPSYHSNAPHRANTTSPFESTFDDHVYPAGRPGFGHNESQNSFGSSTMYGHGPRADDSASQYRDDIPLRNTHSHGMKDTGSDHVYDAPPPMMGMAGQEDDRRRSRRGFGFFQKSSGRIPWVIYSLTIIQVAVFIAEIVKMGVLTGIPIQTKPSFNPMIGPSPYVLINMGARYVPCMHNVASITTSDVVIQWPCPNSTTLLATDPQNQCTLGQLCGFGGLGAAEPHAGGKMTDKPEPNQWFRFILPIFLHAGIIHIGFNMLLQMTMGREMEIAIGPIRLFLVYMASGIFGFVMGGNFAAEGIASTGASGSLFGIIALTLLDLLYTWKLRPSPWKDAAFIALDIIISFVLGLLPGLDNFSHIGGFLMGLVLGICILHSPASLQQRIQRDPPYTPVSQVKASDGDDPNAGITGFVKSPVGFFKGRKGAWWAWWLVRVGALVAVFIVFILLLNNFYVYRNTCSWCKYLSCLDITVGGTNWCTIGNLNFTQTTVPAKRALEGGAMLLETMT